ncbi:MAG: ABC transporter permease [Clostridia bacterium]|nr:ABC transporter permease [Clostridia bacterium]
MGLGKCFKMAISSIINNKMRSFLTMLGIIIGIAAVIILVSVMNGLTSMVTSTFEEIGVESITITVTPRATRSVSPEEMFEFVNENSDLYSNASPNVTLSGTLKTTSSGSDSITSRATGVAETYQEMKELELSFGRFIQYIDCEREEKVCVIGSYQALYFFNSASRALNQYLKINGEPYKIVGVLEETEDSSQSSADNCVYIPYTVAAKKSTISVINNYTVTAKSKDIVTKAAEKLEEFMEEKIGDSDYYTVTSMLSIIEQLDEMLNSMGMVLVAIAGISLLVGGIGIMNIMLVSVTERTREIGIRKSLGAKQRNIMTQFVMEAGTVSCIGGVIGIILGSVFSLMAGKLLDMDVKPSVEAIAVAFGVSVAIGIAFGFLPAKKAAQLNPIDALRHE